MLVKREIVNEAQSDPSRATLNLTCKSYRLADNSRYLFFSSRTGNETSSRRNSADVTRAKRRGADNVKSTLKEQSAEEC